jgi:ABC-2 type transport system permease protein
MTASIITGAAAPAAAPRLAGLDALVRKERMEWFRGRRAWVVLAVTTIFMVLTAASAWITTTLREALPAEEAVDVPPVSMAPLDNIGAAVGAQFFILVAIFAVASLVVRERESGTLAWVASKPVSRSSIFLAKWIAATAMLAILAAIVPLGITAAIAVPMYGMPDSAPLIAVGIGMIATVAFYAAVGLVLGTILPSTAAVAGVAFGVFALPLFVGLIPLPLTQFLPHAILDWIMGVASGAEVGFVTPIAYVVITVAIAAYGVRRMERMEL